MSALPSSISSALLSSLHAAYAQLPNEASALQALRRRAWDYFSSHGVPTTRDESWKYTSLYQLDNREFGAVTSSPAIDHPNVADAYRLMFINGVYQAASSTRPTQAGVSIKPLSELSPEQFAAALETDANSSCRFAALNTALARDGVLIELAHDVVLDKPLQLHFIWNGEQGSMTHPRIAVRMGRNSKLILLEEYSSSASDVCFTNVVTTIGLDEGARLEYSRVQAEATGNFHIGLIQAEIAAHATLISHQFNLGAAVSRIDINAKLNGPEANVELNGLQFAGGTQHHDTHTCVDHLVPNTRSSEDYRGIADQRGRVVFNGKVRVHKKAIGTDAQQSSRNLLLAPRAEIDTKPELEIYADDVKCAHGATVGQLDANALFYLRSRGLDEKQARALLTQAFADAVISRVSLESVREQLAKAVHERFSATLEMPA